ncbi:MAG: secretion protein HlyD [Proteobacteria bacterium]|nr:secretion protein HlyD [Pseudomonadota bacterium]
MSARNGISQFRSQPGEGLPQLHEVEVEHRMLTDTRQPMRLGLWVLGLGLGGFLLWLSFAPLDEGVPTSGMVAIDTKRKAVQHLQGGIVRQVLVKEGQRVGAGDILFRLDDSYVRANFESVRQHYLTVRATEGRLLAEQSGAASIDFHQDLLKADGDPLVQQHVALQKQLFASRRAALKTEIAAIEESIQGNEAQLQGNSNMLIQRQSQLALLQEQLKGIRELVGEGYAPRNRQLEMERSASEVSGSIAELQGNILRLRRSISELRLHALQRKQDQRKEIDAQLADVLREVQADAEKFKAVGEELAQTTIRSPADGQVVGLAVQSVGAVIQPGQKLMDVVPSDEVLLIETRVPPHMVDRVRPGLDADVRFSAFAHSPQLVVAGRIESISTDLISEPQGSQGSISYYLARVSITPEGARELGGRQLQAGMPVEVIFKTGSRTVLTYFLHPLTKRIAGAMKEE